MPGLIPVTVANPEAWPEIESEIVADTSLPVTVSTDVLIGFVSSAVPLYFSATADPTVLRGTFLPDVIKKYHFDLEDYAGFVPGAVTVSLVSYLHIEGPTTFRIHLAITSADPEVRRVVNEFWDLQLGDTVVVGLTECPGCGGPIAPGQLICVHCGTDVRHSESVPVTVSRVQFY